MSWKKGLSLTTYLLLTFTNFMFPCVCTTCILAAFREEGNISSLGLEFQVVGATENQTKVFCKRSKAVLERWLSS